MCPDVHFHNTWCVILFILMSAFVCDISLAKCCLRQRHNSTTLMSYRGCKRWCLFTLMFCFTADHLVWPGVFQVTMADRRSLCSGTTWRCFGPPSRLMDPHILHILSFIPDILSMQLVNWDFVILFCTCNIYFTSVHAGRGIPPLWLFLRFLP